MGAGPAGYVSGAVPLVYEAHRRAKGHTMRFNPKARIDQSQIETRSGGGRGGGGMRLPMPGGGGGRGSASARSW